MPWTETRPMQRLDFIRASFAGTDSFSALCRRFGISRKTGYKWLERFDPSEPASFLTAHARHILIPVLFRLISSRI
ncbi:helix-turn-helix domain-containing protein [Klebsiella aerogenes]|uniref:helix-turn-helix domain-containing protein n=1 Tax=Klebsiella aerogenes TaxID=548 RepID=UPI00388F62E6